MILSIRATGLLETLIITPVVADVVFDIAPLLRDDFPNNSTLTHADIGAHAIYLLDFELAGGLLKSIVEQVPP